MIMEAPIAAIDSVVQTEELQQLFEAAEVAGSVRAVRADRGRSSRIALEPLEVDAVYRMFEERGIEVVDDGEREEPCPSPAFGRRRRSRRRPTRCSSSCARPAGTRC